MNLVVLENFKKENVEIYLEYLNSCKSSNWETWETTYKTYCNNFKLFIVWFQKAYKNRLLLSKDTLMEMPTIIESYRNYCRNLGNSKRTLMNKTTAISTFYAWCVRRNKIKYHPFSEKLDRLRFTEKDKVRNKNPTYDPSTNMIREMSREELIEEGIEVQLEPGEVVRDKKIVKIPKPNKNEKYLTWNRDSAIWEYDSKREKDDYFNLVDQLKNEALEYGFDYKNHRQRLRTKDLIYMEISIKSLEIGKKKTKRDLKSTWYFQDGFGMPMSVEDLEDMMFSGTMFIQSIFNSESFFKTEIEPKELTITEFKNKVNELHKLVMKAVGGKE